MEKKKNDFGVGSAGSVRQAVALFEQAAERLRPYLKRSGFGYYPRNQPTKRVWLDPDEMDSECCVARDEYLRLLRELAVFAESLGYDSTPFLMVESKLHDNCYQSMEDARHLCRRLVVAEEVNSEITATASLRSSGGKKVSVNARMMDMISRDQNCHSWSAQQFAEVMGCSKSTISETKAWASLRTYREMARMERAGVKQSRWQKKGEKPDD